MDRSLPQVVVRPTSGAKVAEVVKVAVRERLAVTARGGASGLSGGVIPIEGGIMIDLNRMHRILEVDVENGLALVEPASSTWISRRPSRRSGSTTRPTRPARRPAPSAATSPRTLAGRTACRTA